MAILGDIRKRSWLLIAVIGISLFLFIISSLFDSGFGASGKAGDTIVQVNDVSIPFEQFNQSMERISNQARGQMTDAQISNRVFDNEVRRALLGEIFEQIGLSVEGDQIADYVEEAGWHRSVPDFADENGNFDREAFLDAIFDWKKNDPQRYQLWQQDEEQIVFFSKERMLQNLVRAGMNASLQEGYFTYKAQNNKVDVEFVRVPYTAIADSTITVSKEEIAAYINEHPEDFKQENARNLRYVFFELKPSESDNQAALTRVNTLLGNANPLDNFRSATDLDLFFTDHSDKPLDTLPKQKTQLPLQIRDTIDALAEGDVFGPYKEGDTYNLVRVLGKEPEGNVRARHILIAYKGAMRANESVTRTQEEAKIKAEGVLARAKAEGADFAKLAEENSDGPTASRGGDLGFFQRGQMAANFNDYCFNNPAGSVGLVETEFGFHIIRIEEKQDLYQVAHLVQEIVPSEDTENTIYNEALTFEKKVREAEADQFADIAQQSDILLRPVNMVKAMDENLPGLGNRREIIRWAFNRETNVGDIQKFEMPEGYAIVQMTKEFKEGTQSVEEASILARPEILKKKKAEQLIAKYKGKSMQDIANEAFVSVSKGTAISLSSPVLPGAGREPAIVGKAFSMEVDEVSEELLIGETGVYKIKLLKFNEAIKLPSFAPYATTLSRARLNRVATNFYNSLKEGAEIKDNRSEFY